jgi:hypothetical protein
MAITLVKKNPKKLNSLKSKSKNPKSVSFKKNPKQPFKGIVLKPEQKTQIAFVEYIGFKYPAVFPHVIMIGNEGKRHPITAHIMKMMGLHPGASDLFISYPANGYHGLYIEIKKDGYNFPKADTEHIIKQQAFLASKRALGYQALMCVGIDECMKAIDDYLR